LAFSLLDRYAAQDLIPYCQEYGVPVLAYGCLAKGLLTGKFGVADRVEGLRARSPEFMGDRFARNLALVDRLRSVAQDYDRSVGQLALNWVIHQPGVTVAVVGAKRASQVRENAGAADWRIEDEDLKRIDDILGSS
jgi:aryl-alcohol dehydrogenase-like predicted oxidoreductase